MFQCVSCANKLASTYIVVDGYQLLLCKRCDLLLTNANRSQIKKYVTQKYDKEYVKNYSNALVKLHKRFDQHLALIQESRTGNKLLDIGCGTGHFLKYLNSKRDSWKIYGVEPSKLLREAAQKNTLADIREGTLNKIPFNDNFFDTVTCYDVLEHDIDLEKNIAELRRVLKPKGILLIQAPNYRSLMAFITGSRWDWWCVPDHVLHFSYYFLVQYMKKNGFRVLHSYTYEDQEDFLSNVKSLFRVNNFTKALYYLLIPFFIVVSRIGWVVNMGGLSLLLVQKR